MIRTDDPGNNIHFYKKTDDGFFEATLPELNETSDLTGENVIYGPYENSDYICSLVFTSAAGAEVIMQNIYTDRFFRRGISFESLFEAAGPVTVMGAGFRDSLYSFIQYSGYRLVCFLGADIGDSYRATFL